MRFSVLILAFSLIAAPAFSKPVNYVCKLAVSRDNSWVPEQLVIQYDAAKGSVLVNDPLIQHFHKHPIEGRVKVDNDKRVTFAWDLKMVTNDARQTTPKFLYSATIVKGTKKATVSAVPAGYYNSFSASGKCSVE